MKPLINGLSGLILTACATPSQAPAHLVPGVAGRCDIEQDYDIDFGRFDEMAQQIAHATDCVVVTDIARTGNVKPNSVHGRFTPRQAIAKAIEGTRLHITRQLADTITVE